MSTLRNLLGAAAMTCLLGNAIAQEITAAKLDFAMESQSLEQALGEFAQRTGLQLIFPADAIATHVTAPALVGNFTARDALQRLLASSPYSYEFINAKTVTIHTARQPVGHVSDSDDLLLVQRDRTGAVAERQLWNDSRLAQTDDASRAYSAESAEGHDAGAQLEEVLVTARRREENIQRVPITVQVISPQALAAQNVETVADLQYLVPGLSGSQNTPTQIRLTLRGQGANGNGSWPAVIMFMNDVPLTNFGGGSTNVGPGLFFDLENIQILKGPQGTLFGKGSAGGDILLTTKRPTNEMGGYLDVGIGNYNNREMDGAFNIPLIADKLLTRIAFTSQTRDGYTHILGTPGYPNGIDGDNADTQSLRVSVTFQPTDWFHNDTILTDAKSRTRGTYGVIAEVVPGGSVPAATLQPYFEQQQALGVRTIIPIDVDPVANVSNRSITNISLFDLGPAVTLKNIFGYNQDNNTFAGDQDNTILPTLDIYHNPYSVTVTQYTEELQLAGSSFAKKLDWVLGGFYLDQPLPGVWSVANLGILGNLSYGLNKQAFKSKAVFAHAIYDLSDFVSGLSVNAGVRKTHDSWTFVNAAGGTGLCTVSANDCPTGVVTNTYGKSDALTWSAGIQQQLSEKTMIYLTASKGYRPGGENGFEPLINATPPPFDPEYVLEYDLGLKSDFHLGDIPVRTNAALWYQDYTGIQKQVVHAGSGTWTQNAGQAHLWGAELEANARLTPDLEVGLNYGGGKLEYVNFLSGVTAADIAFLNASKTFSFPKTKYSAYVRYDLPISSDAGGFSVEAHWNWQSDSGDYTQANGNGIIKAFGLLNLSASWTDVNTMPVDLEFYMSNATNKLYLTQASPSWMPGLGYTTQVYGMPRMYGARLRYRFGAE